VISDSRAGFAATDPGGPARGLHPAPLAAARWPARGQGHHGPLWRACAEQPAQRRER